MAIRVTDQQLDEIERGREAALIVRSKRTRKGYAVIAESVFQRVEPLLQFVALRLDEESNGDQNGGRWIEENNARRVELINKKFDRGLSALEKKELAALSTEAGQFRDHASAVHTQVLELILAGLKRQASGHVTD